MDEQNRLGKFIKSKREEMKLSLRSMEERTGLSRTYLSILERGHDIRTGKPVSPTIESMRKLAKGLGVPLEELISLNSAENFSYHGAVHFDTGKIRMIPVLGVVSAGKPDLADNLIDAYWPMDLRLLGEYCTEEEIEKSFYLSVKGDSMMPIINEGDLVLIGPQEPDDGDIALVMLGNKDACLKRVFFLENHVMLSSVNPDYMPVTIRKSECDILGKALIYIGLLSNRFKTNKCR